MYSMSGRLDLECSVFESLHVFKMEKMCKSWCGLHNKSHSWAVSTNRQGRQREKEQDPCVVYTSGVQLNTPTKNFSLQARERNSTASCFNAIKHTFILLLCSVSYLFLLCTTWIISPSSLYNLYYLPSSAYLPSSYLSVIILQLIHSSTLCVSCTRLTGMLSF